MVMSGTKQIQGILVAPYKGEFVEIGKSIAKTLKKDNIELDLIDDSIPAGTLWIERVQRAIERADFILADITDKNPDVMYEVGFARALRKRILPVVKRGVGRIPFVLAGYTYLIYDPENLDDLSQEIRSWASRQRWPGWLAERALARYEAKKSEQSS